MISTSKSIRHSAHVEMELRVDGEAFRVGQLGPGFLILRPSVELPPCIGEVLVRIDGHETRFPVRLDSGSSVRTPKTPIRSATAAVSAA